jgi:hypothetical protein
MGIDTILGVVGAVALSGGHSRMFNDTPSRFGHLPENLARQGRKELEKRRAKNKAAAKQRRKQK